jgi:hypothetical protein
MMKLKGARIPPTIVFPIQLWHRTSVIRAPRAIRRMLGTSLIPLSLLHQMYPS